MCCHLKSFSVWEICKLLIDTVHRHSTVFNGIQQKKLVNYKNQFEYSLKTGYVYIYIMNTKIENYFEFFFWLPVPTIHAIHVNHSIDQMSEFPIDCSFDCSYISTPNSLIRLSVPKFPRQTSQTSKC